MIKLLFSVSDSIFVSFFSVLIVFSILTIITLAIQSLKFIHEKPKVSLNEEITPVKPFQIDDITDPDMMVAALVASIDYQALTQGDIKVISVKEIKN